MHKTKNKDEQSLSIGTQNIRNSSLSYQITDSLNAMLTTNTVNKRIVKNPENRMENGNNKYVNQSLLAQKILVASQFEG